MIPFLEARSGAQGTSNFNYWDSSPPVSLGNIETGTQVALQVSDLGAGNWYFQMNFRKEFAGRKTGEEALNICQDTGLEGLDLGCVRELW